LSILLSRFGIRHLVIDRRESIGGGVPRARGVTHRTGEIWELFGLGQELRRMSLGPEWLERIVYQETLAGPLLGTIETPSNSPGACSHLTPSDFYCISQEKTDGMLARCAASHRQATLRFGTSFIAATQGRDGVQVTLQTKAGRENVRADWLIGCDGASSDVRAGAGLGQTRLATLDSFINAQFEANLDRWTDARKAVLLWNMQEGAEGVFGPLDGRHYWRCQINFDPTKDRNEEWTENAVISRLKVMIGVNDEEMPRIKLRSFYPFEVRAALASSFTTGRVILAGDAAHQIPPHGAMGMNTAVQSAHNVAWKLAAVIQGHASTQLLDTYETERREVAGRVIDHAIRNYERMARIRNEATPQQRRDSVRGAHHYGNSLGLDIGVHYEGQGAFIPDGHRLPEVQDVSLYTPTASPGWRAPHFWLNDGEGRISSSISLSNGRFVLLCGTKGEGWKAAAKSPGLGVGLDAYIVGPSGDLRPESADFEDLYGIDADGCVLIRPDGHVAFRSGVGPTTPLRLQRTMREIGFEVYA
jgi:2-polyprenyl-6-methoxyphenol hydroxylase-like FAD-dependent oxidoreductase